MDTILKSLQELEGVHGAIVVVRCAADGREYVSLALASQVDVPSRLAGTNRGTLGHQLPPAAKRHSAGSTRTWNGPAILQASRLVGSRNEASSDGYDGERHGRTAAAAGDLTREARHMISDGAPLDLAESPSLS